MNSHDPRKLPHDNMKKEALFLRLEKHGLEKENGPAALPTVSSINHQR